MKYRINANVITCGEEFKKGEIVYRYPGCTYGCISQDGIACSRIYDETPFIEIPKEVLEPIKEGEK